MYLFGVMMEELKKILKDKGISPSLHRIKVLEFLSTTFIHPSADDIYQNLVPDIPTLSRTTVYNIVKLFCEKGIILSFATDEKELHYEFNLDPHAHFKCRICGKIFDIEKDYENLTDNIVDGHKVEKHHVTLTGICRECLEKQED